MCVQYSNAAILFCRFNGHPITKLSLLQVVLTGDCMYGISGNNLPIIQFNRANQFELIQKLKVGLRNHFLFSLFSKIGEEQSTEDAEDGPPELLVSCIKNQN